MAEAFDLREALLDVAAHCIHRTIDGTYRMDLDVGDQLVELLREHPVEVAALLGAKIVRPPDPVEIAARICGDIDAFDCFEEMMTLRGWEPSGGDGRAWRRVDREPQPGDGPDYQADHAAWVERQSQ